MSEINTYILVGLNDQEGEYEYRTMAEAQEVAEKQGDTAILMRTYTYDDTELIWTPNGKNHWPPTEGDKEEEEE